MFACSCYFVSGNIAAVCNFSFCIFLLLLLFIKYIFLCNKEAYTSLWCAIKSVLVENRKRGAQPFTIVCFHLVSVSSGAALGGSAWAWPREKKNKNKEQTPPICKPRPHQAPPIHPGAPAFMLAAPCTCAFTGNQSRGRLSESRTHARTRTRTRTCSRARIRPD